MISACRLFLRNSQCGQSVISPRVERIAYIHIYLSRSSPVTVRTPFPRLNKPTGILISSPLRFSSTLEESKVNISDAQPKDVVNQSSPTTSESSNIGELTANVNPSTTNIILDPIPEPPIPVVEPIIEAVGGEPSFESLGLGGWGPVGIIENCFEWLHITCDLPWWMSIAIGTIVCRILLFPLVIISQRNAAKMNNFLPQMQVIQLKMTEARERGDRLDAARYSQEMMLFMKEKKLNPLKNMLVPMAQAPVFVSFFMGLREMSNLPVESLRQGGMYWFTDLTVPDQFYLLPLITSATLALTIELGTDTGRLQASNMGMLKYILRAVPIIVFPFTMNFSSALLVYWVSSNFISLGQVAILRIPAVRDYFKIEKINVHDKNSLPIKEKGFVRGVSDSWTNMKLSRELEERERVDQMQFRRAGRGAIQKTYKYDPTKPLPPRSIPIQAKKRE